MRIYAGYDETSVWQEFGEMKFQTPQDVPDEWGPPDPDLPNAVAAGTPASPRGRPDRNCGATPVSGKGRAREPSHTRSPIPSVSVTTTTIHTSSPTTGRAPAPSTCSTAAPSTGRADRTTAGRSGNPGRLDARRPDRADQDQARLPRRRPTADAVAAGTRRPRSGRVRRPRPVGEGEEEPTAGCRDRLGYGQAPACDVNTDPFCFRPRLHRLHIETVQRIGADSFTPDHGVMLTKNKPFDDEGASCVTSASAG